MFCAFLPFAIPLLALGIGGSPQWIMWVIT
jgi:hypothetical protein